MPQPWAASAITWVRREHLEAPSGPEHPRMIAWSCATLRGERPWRMRLVSTRCTWTGRTSCNRMEPIRGAISRRTYPRYTAAVLGRTCPPVSRARSTVPGSRHRLAFGVGDGPPGDVHPDFVPAPARVCLRAVHRLADPDVPPGDWVASGGNRDSPRSLPRASMPSFALLMCVVSSG